MRHQHDETSSSVGAASRGHAARLAGSGKDRSAERTDSAQARSSTISVPLRATTLRNRWDTSQFVIAVMIATRLSQLESIALSFFLVWSHDLVRKVCQLFGIMLSGPKDQSRSMNLPRAGGNQVFERIEADRFFSQHRAECEVRMAMPLAFHLRRRGRALLFVGHVSCCEPASTPGSSPRADFA